METLVPKKLPVVFKFSHLSRILIFYGFLHEWKVLMERLNRESSSIWKHNLEAFIKWGENNKAKMLVKTNSQRLKKFTLNFDDNCKFIRNFSADEFGLFDDWIPKIMEVWSSDKIVLVTEEIESDDSTLIGIKDIF